MTNTNENFTPDRKLGKPPTPRHLYTGERAGYEATRGVHAIHQVRRRQHNGHQSAGREERPMQRQIRCERAAHTGAHGQRQHGK